MLSAVDMKALRRVAEVAKVAAITGSCCGGLREPPQSRQMAASPRSSNGEEEKHWSRCRWEVEAMLSEVRGRAGNSGEEGESTTRLVEPTRVRLRR